MGRILTEEKAMELECCTKKQKCSGSACMAWQKDFYTDPWIRQGHCIFLKDLKEE